MLHTVAPLRHAAAIATAMGAGREGGVRIATAIPAAK